MQILLLLLGFLILIKGASLLVDGSASIAKKAKISDLIIGLTIVAFGTSSPELAINIIASLKGNTDIAIGNILGSNIANVFLILGISACIFPITIHKTITWREIPFAFLVSLVLGFIANDIIIDGASKSVISRIDGFVLISFFLVFVYYIVSVAKRTILEKFEEMINVKPQETQEIIELSLMKSIIYVIVGLASLTLGGKFIVDGAIYIAQHFGLSESMIGLTIIAIGTGLPELATSAIAAYKKNTDIAIGNVIGSNIFNILFVLGISAVISPLPFGIANQGDLILAILCNIILFVFIFIGEKNIIQRWQGALFVIIYISYITSLIIKEI